MKVPTWMTVPGSSEFKIVEQAEINPRALLCIVDLIDSVVNGSACQEKG